ncbi:STY1053 family phage-associated protein [Enterobacter roggenkampii]
MSTKPVSILVHTPFTLTLADNSEFKYGKGRHSVPQEHANHWFTQHHADITDGVTDSGGDQQALVDSLQAQIADKDVLIADLKDALLKMQEQNEGLQAQIASAQAGGSEAKDVKESKSANGK